MVPPAGFEPEFPEPESGVLPIILRGIMSLSKSELRASGAGQALVYPFVRGGTAFLLLPRGGRDPLVRTQGFEPWFSAWKAVVLDRTRRHPHSAAPRVVHTSSWGDLSCHRTPISISGGYW
jgi:hypothetical protein